MIDADTITKPVATVTAIITMIGGIYSVYDKVKFPKDIIKWDAEHFSISNGPASGEFKVIVARQKLRDDCSVEDFTLEVRDSGYIMHKALPSVAKFSGPANEKVDKFGYTMKIENPETVSSGEAKLIARIVYKCPEGETIVYIVTGKQIGRAHV